VRKDIVVVVAQSGMILNLSCVWLQLVELTSLNARTGRAYPCIRDVTVYVIVQMEKMN